MEGVSGIGKWEQGTGGEPLYEEGRRLYTEEINAAVRGARAAGATEIVVMDCHGAGGPWNFNSLVPDLLDPSCEYVVQEEWTDYTGFLEQGCDAALFIGMHARAGTREGVMNHTVSGQACENPPEGAAVGFAEAVCDVRPVRTDRGTGGVCADAQRCPGRRSPRGIACRRLLDGLAAVLPLTPP